MRPTTTTGVQEVETDAQQPVDGGLSITAHHRRNGRRRCRVGFRQPDVQRQGDRLGAKPARASRPPRCRPDAFGWESAHGVGVVAGAAGHDAEGQQDADGTDKADAVSG